MKLDDALLALVTAAAFSKGQGRSTLVFWISFIGGFLAGAALWTVCAWMDGFFYRRSHRQTDRK